MAAQRKKDTLPNILDHPIDASIAHVKKFSKDSYHLIMKCTKPDLKEFKKLAIATSIGFLLMGFIGFFIRLIHIPINNIIRGSS
mmetsp:Transcript_38084/g.62508  ORF Transcript_38084/g.62508 Transcript_38084/m.62508 type:complete len:84 (-) Transcript_38084:676-927(-)